MLWTVAVIADSAQAFYETLVRRLRDEEREVLWRDYIRFGELFGMPRDAAPGSYHEFRVLWDEMWSGGDLHLTQEARAVALAVAFEIPLPRYLHGAREVHNLILTGTLPERARRMFGLRWTAGHRVAFRAAVAATRAPRPLTPARLRRGYNTSSFELVARTEKQLVESGKPTLPSEPAALSAKTPGARPSRAAMSFGARAGP
jgi:uncharacterized protein (DUF2236 family)